MADLIQLRGGSAAAWTSANPILAQKELGVETDSKAMKMGDGLTAWNSLAYLTFPERKCREVLATDTGFGITLAGTVATIATLPGNPLTYNGQFFAVTETGTGWCSLGGKWRDSLLPIANITNLPARTSGDNIRIIQGSTQDWLPVVLIEDDNPKNIARAFVSMERGAASFGKFLDIDLTGKETCNFAVVCNNWTSEDNVYREFGAIGHFMLIPRGGIEFVCNYEINSKNNWVPISGAAANVFIGKHYGADGWGNDAAISKNGLFERFSLNEIEYNWGVERPFFLDASTTSAANPYIAGTNGENKINVYDSTGLENKAFILLPSTSASGATGPEAALGNKLSTDNWILVDSSDYNERGTAGGCIVMAREWTRTDFGIQNPAAPGPGMRDLSLVYPGLVSKKALVLSRACHVRFDVYMENMGSPEAPDYASRWSASGHFGVLFNRTDEGDGWGNPMELNHEGFLKRYTVNERTFKKHKEFILDISSQPDGAPGTTIDTPYVAGTNREGVLLLQDSDSGGKPCYVMLPGKSHFGDDRDFTLDDTQYFIDTSTTGPVTVYLEPGLSFRKEVSHVVGTLANSTEVQGHIWDNHYHLAYEAYPSGDNWCVYGDGITMKWQAQADSDGWGNAIELTRGGNLKRFTLSEAQFLGQNYGWKQVYYHQCGFGYPDSSIGLDTTANIQAHGTNIGLIESSDTETVWYWDGSSGDYVDSKLLRVNLTTPVMYTNGFNTQIIDDPDNPRAAKSNWLSLVVLNAATQLETERISIKANRNIQASLPILNLKGPKDLAFAVSCNNWTSGSAMAHIDLPIIPDTMLCARDGAVFIRDNRTGTDMDNWICVEGQSSLIAATPEYTADGWGNYALKSRNGFIERFSFSEAEYLGKTKGYFKDLESASYTTIASDRGITLNIRAAEDIYIDGDLLNLGGEFEFRNTTNAPVTFHLIGTTNPQFEHINGVQGNFGNTYVLPSFGDYRDCTIPIIIKPMYQRADQPFASQWSITHKVLEYYHSHQAGIEGEPLITDHGNGTLSIDASECWFYTDTTRDNATLIALAGGTILTPTDDVTGYVCANKDTADWAILNAISSIDYMQYIPYFKVIKRAGNNNMHFQKIPHSAHGAMEVEHEREMLCIEYQRAIGALEAIAVDTSLNLTLSGGIVFAVRKKYTIPAVTTATRQFKCINTGASWTISSNLAPVINNTQYNGPSGAVTLTDTYWTINYIYRGIEDQDHCYTVLGTAEYATKELAQASNYIASLPELITAHAMLVGRVIVQKGATTGIICESSFKTIFAASTAISDHGSQSGLGDDDHLQYHTDARGDVRYVKKANTPVAGLAFTFDTTVGGNPANGRVRLGSGNYITTTTLHVSELDANSVGCDGVIDMLTTVGCLIKLCDRDAPDTNFYWYKVTASFTSTGAPLYDPIPVAYLFGQGAFTDTTRIDFGVELLSPVPATTKQIIFNDAGALAGDAALTFDKALKQLLLAAGYIGNTAAAAPTPVAATLLSYVRDYAGKLLPTFMGPSGVDWPVQSNMFFQKVSAIIATGSTLSAIGTAAMTSNGGSAIAYAAGTTGSILNQLTKITLSTGTTAGAVQYFRPPTGDMQCYLGNAAGSGGFFFGIRFAMSAMQTGQRVFVGLHPRGTTPTNQDPINELNSVGLTVIANSGNWCMSTNNGSGTATVVALSSPAIALNTTDVIELQLFAAPNSTTINYRVTNLTTGAVVTGSLASKTPAVNTVIAPMVWMTNNAQAASVTLNVNKIYLETDY